MKKKVIFFHHSGDIGGAGLSALNVLRAINKEKYDITVYCNSKQKNMVNLLANSGFTVIEGGNSPVIFSHVVGGEKLLISPKFIINLLELFFDAKKIIKVLESNKCDLVIVNSVTLFWIGKIAKSKGINTICFFRETLVNGLFGLRTSLMVKGLERNFDKVIFISKYDSNTVNIGRSKKEVIYNIFKKPEILKTPSNFNFEKINAHFKILYLGGMTQLKGAHVILQAMNYVKSDATLLFIGYDWNNYEKGFSFFSNPKKFIRYLLGLSYEKKWSKFIQRNNLKSKIHFYEVQNDVSPFYDFCDAVVIPITKPHQARPLIEAGYYQKPAIITYFDNISEFATSENCYLFENGDYLDLAKKIDECFSNIQTSEKKVKMNSKFTKQFHSEKTYISEINRVIDEVFE